MLLSALVSDGLVGGPLTVEPAGRAGHSRDVARVAEAVELAAAALDGARLPTLVERFGLGASASVVAEDGTPALAGLDPVAVDRLVEPGRRTITVELTLALDPTLFGRLREQVVREPRLGPALAGGAPLEVKVGWWWTRDRTGGAPSVLAARVGEVAFETVGKDRLPFLGELLASVAGRLRTTDPFEPPDALAARLARAAGSPVPAERAGWAAVRAGVAAPPFGWPTPELVVVDGRAELRFGPALASIRRAGRAAVDAVRWLAGIHLGSPDVLVVPEDVPPPVLEAWRALLESDHAPIEQVLVG